MLDRMKLQPKGRVKIETYNEKGIIDTIEKTNLVVLSANKIIGELMSDPNKTTNVTKKDQGNTSAVTLADGSYFFPLTVVRQIETAYQIELSSTNTNKELTLVNSQPIVKLLKVTVAGVEKVIDQDVFIKHADLAQVVFKDAPTGVVRIEYVAIKNPYVEIIQGTESVKVGLDIYTKSTTPSTTNKTYAVNYELGQIIFDEPKTGVVVEYISKLPYGINFMGIGGKPVGHPDYRPVQFTNSDKLKIDMENEFMDCRQLLQYPSTVTSGAPEIEVTPAKSINVTTRTTSIAITDAAVKTYTIPNDGKPVVQLLEVKRQGNPTPLTVPTQVKIKDSVAGSIEFIVTLTAGDTYDVSYLVQEDNNHLLYQMPESPIFELVAVRHQDNLTLAVSNYNMVGNGLKVGEGDVWIVNSNQGIIQFNPNPTGGPVPHTPGMMTFEYRVNSGTTVNYIADFPKGIPGPVRAQYTESLAVSSTQTVYPLRYPVLQNESAKFVITGEKNGTALLPTDFAVKADGTEVTLNFAPAGGDTISFTYDYMKETHEIYQVGMFTDAENGKMFNIAGVGPITKDKNTGMRVTWSVTY